MIPAIQYPAGWYEKPEIALGKGKCRCEKCPKCDGVKFPHKAVDSREEVYECWGNEDDTECEGHD